MSSVLMGIIGVALFIGIAIASVVFIGPQFTDAQNDAAATSTIEAVSRVAQASSGFRLASGIPYGPALGDMQRLADEGYLNRMPDNTVVPGRSPRLVDATGTVANASSTSFVPQYAFMSIGDRRDICTMVARRFGSIPRGQQVSTTQITIDAFAAGKGGCFRTRRATGNIQAGEYVAFARV